MTLRMPTFGRRPATEADRFGVGRLFRDAMSLASASIIGAIFALACWAITARLIAPAELGVMTAILAVITTVAVAITATISDAYASILPSVGSARAAVLRRGERLFALSSVVGGVLAGTAAIVGVHAVRGSLAVFALVVVGTFLLGMFLLQSNVLPAIGRANWQIVAATSQNLFRLILLIAFALTFQWHSLELSLIISAGLTALFLTPLIYRVIHALPSTLTTADIALPADRAVRLFNAYVYRSFPAVVLGYAIFSVTPFLVTVFGEAKEGALFALSWTVVQMLELIGGAMGTSLVVHGSAEPAGAAAMARSVLVKSQLLILLGAVVAALTAPFVLLAMNPEYGPMGATTVISTLALAAVFKVPFNAWEALQRSRRKLRPRLIVSFLGALVAVIGVSVLSRLAGAEGGAIGVALAFFTLSVGAGVHTFWVWRIGRRQCAR